MNRQSIYVLSTGTLVIALATALLVLSPSIEPRQNGQTANAEISDTGILDGMTFVGTMRLVEESDGVNDTFVFADGTFASTECDKRCGYPARPYFVRHVSDKVEFVSESRCLYKDAKIVWRGTVDDGTLKGVSTWTVNRWYWTIEKEFAFEGTLIETAAPVASIQ